MKNLLFLFVMLPLMVSCQHSKYPYSKIETEAFLNDITKHAKVSITDITEIKQQPTDVFQILSRYPLSKKKLVEYNKSGGTVVNKDDDIADFTNFTLKSYELTNEKNKKLQLADQVKSAYLQEYGLWEYDNVICQNIGIELKLNDKFEKLKGYINIEFAMPDKSKKELKVPVQISITDKITE